MSGDLTYDVRVWKTEIYRGAKVTTYTVRWKAGAKLQGGRSVSPPRRIASAPSWWLLPGVERRS